MQIHEFLGKIGSRIRKLRLAHGLTQEKLAAKTGLHYKFIGNLETGKVNISVTNLLTITTALQVPLFKLLDFDEPLEFPQQVPNKDRMLKIISEIPVEDMQRIVRIIDILH